MTDVRHAISRVLEFRLHPLGFYYLEDKLGGGGGQRIHVWLSEGPDGAENDKHQHTFDIASTIVEGCIRSELFQFLERTDGSEREFSVIYGEGHSTLSFTGRLGVVQLLCSFESVKGSGYFLKAGTIYRVVALERPCVTVLKTQERNIPIFAYGTEPNEAPFERRHVDAGEARQLSQVLSKIEIA
jgi:hypothetical protein